MTDKKKKSLYKKVDDWLKEKTKRRKGCKCYNR